MSHLASLYRIAVQNHRSGRSDVAAELCQQVLETDPAFARAWELWGLVLHGQGRLAQAIECVERAIQLEPQWNGFFHDLGNIYWSAGRHEDAEKALRTFLNTAPNSISGLATLGKVLYALGRTAESIAVFDRVLALCTDNPVSLAAAYSEFGLDEQAGAAYLHASQVSPDAALRIMASIQLPFVYRTREHLVACRQRLETQIDSLIRDGVLQNLETREATPVFNLPHQGLNDVVIQKKLAQLYRAPELPAPQLAARANGELSVAFISSYFSQHTVGKLTSRLITRLAQDHLHVTVFAVAPGDNPVAHALSQSVQRFIALPRNLRHARQTILASDVDVLIYTDIGMDQFTYSLAYSRLAPVQCVTWGHAETTGIETIDYFVSSDLMETAAAEGHYSEKLVPAFRWFSIALKCLLSRWIEMSSASIPKGICTSVRKRSISFTPISTRCWPAFCGGIPQHKSC